MKFPKKNWHPQRRKYNSYSNLVRKCLILWSKAIKINGNNRCGLCGSDILVESHHIVRKSTRIHYGWFLIENGIVLCYRCHYDGIHSIHFPTVQDYQTKINDYLARKSMTYEELYEKCNSIEKIDRFIIEKCIINIQKHVDNKNI